MQATVELQEMFGAEVLVQLREPLFKVEIGELAVAPVMRSDGTPEVMEGPKGLTHAAREYVRPKLPENGEATYYLLARIGPASGGRINICYELGNGHIAYVAVRPESILAVTMVHKLARAEEKLIKS